MKRIVLALLLVGCATGYHPNDFRGGYSQHQLDQRSYEVRFEGNANTSFELARDYAYRRAGELALERGFAGFVVLDEDDNRVRRTLKPRIRLTVRFVNAGESAPGVYHDARLALAR